MRQRIRKQPSLLHARGAACVLAAVALVGFDLGAQNFGVAYAKSYVDLNYAGGGRPGWSQAGDLDRDGDIDLIVGGGRAMVAYENDGSARGWQSHSNLDGTRRMGCNGGVLTDLDGDGDLDVVAAQNEGAIGWWQNPGPPLRATGWPFRVAFAGWNGWFTHDLIQVDLDGDGVRGEYLVVLQRGYWNASLRIVWLEPGSDPRNAWQVHTVAYDQPGPNNNHSGVDVGDIDRDGDIDIAFCNGWFENGGNPRSSWSWHSVDNSLYGISNVLLDDVDGDGRVDLVVSCGHHGQGVYWLEAPPDPRANSWAVHPVDSQVVHPEGMQISDVDLDGDLDIVATELFFGEQPGEPLWSDEEHNIYLYERLATATPSWRKHNIAPNSYPSHLIQLVDVNGDGRLDIISEGSGFSAVSYYERRVSGGEPTARLSVSASANGAGGNADSGSGGVDLSLDGSVCAFTSDASDLVAGDTNGAADIFVRPVPGGATTRVSVSSAGAQANGASAHPSLSGDAGIVAFETLASNLVTGDANGVSDVYVRDRVGNRTLRISVGLAGSDADGPSRRPSVSADGLWVAFESDATNLVPNDTNGVTDIFVAAVTTGSIRRISVSGFGAEGNGTSSAPSISGDGRLIAFASEASNLVAGDGNGVSDVFVYDQHARTTERVSVASSGAEGNGASRLPTITPSGSAVAFSSEATNLVPADTNGQDDVFVRDRVPTGRTERVSVDSDGAEVQAPSGFHAIAISADARHVAFASSDSVLFAGAPRIMGRQVVFRDRRYDLTTGLGDRNGASGTAGVQQGGRGLATDGSGRWVVLDSLASDLVDDDENRARDVFLFDSFFAYGVTYGDGFAGTHGLSPGLAVRHAPAIGAVFELEIDNATSAERQGLVVWGFTRASIPTGLGGVLQVALDLATPPVTVPPGRSVWTIGELFGGPARLPVPNDTALVGAGLFAQLCMQDPGASAGWAFSRPVATIVGH